MITQVTEPGRIEVIALDEYSWRIASLEFEPANPDCVLAYVDKLAGDRFSVLMLAPKSGLHAECSSMDEAIEMVLAHVDANSSGRRHRPYRLDESRSGQPIQVEKKLSAPSVHAAAPLITGAPHRNAPAERKALR